MNIHADNIPTTSLLTEWCDVCQYQCVIDHELKSKLTIHLDQASCEDIQALLAENTWSDQISGRWFFRKQQRGDWIAYTCLKRSASDIAAKLKQVISPTGKYDHIMADNVSSQLWVPKAFYDKHASIISSLDVTKPAYSVNLSWVRLNQQKLRSITLSDEGKRQLRSWVSGSPLSLGLDDILNLIAGLEKEGGISVISEVRFILTEDELLEAKLEEYTDVMRYDKKGKLLQISQPQGVWLKMSAHHIQNSIMIDLILEDRFFLESMPIQEESQIMLKTKVPILVGNSHWLGGVMRKVDQETQTCLPIISKLPLIGRVFCKTTHQKAEKQHALIISIHPVT